jgi:hypothetical protein
VYVELGSSGSTIDDAGETNYTVTDPSTTGFQVQLRTDDNGPGFWVYLASFGTDFSKVGDTIPVGWYHNGVLPWIVSGNEDNFSTNAMPTDWMQSNLASFGCQPLRHLCIPGSHDAGMSALNGHTFFSNEQNTVTQGMDISGQLANGARFFDVRPVVAGGVFVTGHYSYVNQFNSWQGGNGQSLDQIIDQVNDFLGQNQELVILDLSHTVDTDNDYQALSQDQWNQLLTQLMGLQHRYGAPPNTADLSTLTLRDFIGSSPAVIVIFEDAVNLGSFANQGFYSSSYFHIYNSYSNSDDPSVMEADQLQKMQQQRPNPDAAPFLLSWTLTQQSPQDIDIVGRSIIDLAQTVFPDLFTNKFWGALSRDTYPNFIMIDAWSPDRRLAALVVAINKYFAGGC